VRPLRARLEKARRDSGLPWEVLERDYLLSWVLAGIGASASLGEVLVFKGGTALKKCYFGDYRLSEDLDFSALADVPRGDALLEAMKAACATAEDLVGEYAPVEVSCDRYVERDPHPTGQEAFVVRSRLPWHRGPQSRLLVEVTVDEPILTPVRSRALMHEYGEPLDAGVLVYSLEEIVAEKLRALLQHTKSLDERGWSRSRARDYYDLWRIFGAYRPVLDLAGFPDLLERKCAVRSVAFGGVGDFFDPRVVALVKDTWRQWLGPLVSPLPDVDTVLESLRAELTRSVFGPAPDGRATRG
jgi:predicted nucleotidyltransferase component of viral defense system